MTHARTFAIPALLALAALAPRPARAQAAASLVPMPRAQFFDSAGRPLAGGCVWTYAAGSSTPLSSYKNAAGTANTNPVVLDSAGRADIWLGAGQAYKISVSAKTSAGCVGATTPLYTADGVIDQGFALVRQLQNGSLAIGLVGLPLVGAGGGVGIGNAMLSATTGGLYVSVNGGPPELLTGGGSGGGGGAAGPATSLQYNGGGTPAALAGSANLKWDNGGKDLVICGAPATGCTASSGVEAPTFSSFGAASAKAFITNVTGGAVGSSYINNDGNGFFQGLNVTNTFNSLATGPTLAISQATGTFNITGAGDAGFQTMGLGLKASAVTGFGGGVGVGEALLSATTAGLYLSLNGAPPALVGGGGGSGTPGAPTTSIQYNNAGTFAGSANLLWDNAQGILTLTKVGANSSFNGPIFVGNVAAGGNTFENSDMSFHIDSSGNGFYQGLAVTATFNSLATGVTKALTQSTGTFFITGAGDASFQSTGIGLHASPVTGLGGGVGVGEARLSATTAGLYLSLNGAPPALVGGGGGSGTPGGVSTNIQFNNAGAFAGSANLTWNSGSNVLNIAGTSGTSGVIARTFTGNATGADLSFQTTGNTWQVDAAGDTSQTGSATVSGGAGGAVARMIGNAATYRGTYYYTGTGLSSGTRWYQGEFPDAETGGNVGSAWVLSSYSDAGALLANPIVVNRSDGFVRMNGGLAVGSYTLTSAGALNVASCTGCGGAAPGGAVTQVQFNNGTGFGGSSSLTWNGAILTAPEFSAQCGSSALTCITSGSGTWSINGAGTFLGQAITTGSNNGTVATASDGAVISKIGATIGLVVFDTGGHCNVGTGAFSCTSDERLKKNIAPIGDALKAVNALRPVAFDWRGNGEHGFGFVAQEVQKVLPGLVTTDKGGYLELSEMNMIPYLVRSIQQLQEEVDTLRSRVGVRLLNEQLSK